MIKKLIMNTATGSEVFDVSDHDEKLHQFFKEGYFISEDKLIEMLAKVHASVVHYWEMPSGKTGVFQFDAEAFLRRELNAELLRELDEK